MKKLFFILFAALFFLQARAQKCRVKDVPATVMNAFNKAYPNTKKTCWGKDSINYVAEFALNKKPVSVTYNAAGKNIMTEMQMPVEDLPKTIPDYVQKNFPGEIFMEAAQITDADGVVTYEAQVKDMDLVFDAKGGFLQSMKLL